MQMTTRMSMLHSYNSPDVQRWYDYDNVGRVIQEDQYMPAWPQVGRMIATFDYDNKGRITDVSDFQTGSNGRYNEDHRRILACK